MQDSAGASFESFAIPKLFLFNYFITVLLLFYGPRKKTKVSCTRLISLFSRFILFIVAVTLEYDMCTAVD